MEGWMPAVAQVVGVARRLRQEELRRLRTAFGPLTLAWFDGDVRFSGTGEAAVHTGSIAASVLGAAARAPVEVTGEALAPPAPWFCGFAFDGAAPRDAWWESFPAARAVVPAMLLAEGPGAASLTAYEAVGADGEMGARARAEASLQAALALPAVAPQQEP